MIYLTFNMNHKNNVVWESLNFVGNFQIYYLTFKFKLVV